MKKEFLECGLVRAPHGVRGILSVDSWCDTPRVLASQTRVYILGRDGGYVELKIKSASASGDRVILGIEGVETREDAQAYKNTVLYLKREDIPVPKGAMLIADMIGLPVIDANTGVKYGVITDITEVPRGLMYTIKTEKGEVLYPSAPALVAGVDSERGLLVTPISGFFD